MADVLPVADRTRVRRAALGELRSDRRAFAGVLALNALAAGAGLAGPWLLGAIVDTVKDAPGRAALAAVDRLALAIAACTVLQILLSRQALRAGARFGERTAARIRERFLDRALALPAATVERVPTGDLAARGTTDVTAVAVTLRDAVPEVLVSCVQVLFVVGAVVLLDPLLGLCGLAGMAVMGVALRWYLRRARAAYLAEGGANSALAEELSATAAGARTVEALGLQARRVAKAETAIAEARRARLRTLRLRTVLFPAVDVSYALPVVSVLLTGGALHQRGAVSLGTVIASAIYLRQLAGPLDNLLLWVEHLQGSAASYARVEGLAMVPAAGPPTAAVPAGGRIEVTDVRYAYGHGRDVLHGVHLDVRPGERLAVVGPSGAGKSTLGRLLAGVDRPRSGAVTVGGVPVADLAPDELRRQVVLVTQEHHVFHGTLRENLLIAEPAATDTELLAALAAVDAAWAGDLPDGLDTALGGGAHPLGGAQAQQLALARVVLADPHTLVLDEATALLDPATARSTERALAAVLRGRTVIAVAHRLQTAHDADRVAVMDRGVVTELGTHDELVAAGGAYAALWRSWRGTTDTPQAGAQAAARSSRPAACASPEGSP
ncbi:MULTISPECIES: ABC transporter ATP-binding protein [unclassified Streptomyces]|uniref:ABC transporter ATP-binding protein n=1 Tax=unclassified Streptomyces TaxID=2593676 RepID=UPI000366A6B3|nr:MULTISPECIES: ABC transporter ATP-binding protein [unclassified Streptomyces]MYX32324.1 ATP-binding cassette domain-containing protein [Streptomyces sp. SID8377]